MEQGRAHSPGGYALTARRMVALVLLIVLVAALGITSLTKNWIDLLPQHGHLLLGARAFNVVHHAHPGDVRFRSARRLAETETTPGIKRTERGGILSLRPMSAQPELGSSTAYGWVGDFALPLPPPAAALLFLGALLLAMGIRAAPPIGPPRPGHLATMAG